jgi:hypothetical protein
MVSVTFVIPAHPDGLHKINLSAAFLSFLCLRARLFKATEAALLSRMMVFTAVLLKALLSSNEMSTGKQLPTDEDTTARPNDLNRPSTSRNVPSDLNRRCSSAKRLLKSIFIKVQINKKHSVIICETIFNLASMLIDAW